MPLMGLDRKLSTLEFTVLGILLKKAPCTAYSVLMEFTSSATSAYRSGAGSVYPLMGRLEKAGIVQTLPDTGRDKLYALTPDGVEALRDWYDLTIEDDISCCLDVLRSRTYFLKVLEPDERLRFFDNAIKGLRMLLGRCEVKVEEYREAGDVFSEVAMEGAVLETKARITWLERTRARFAKSTGASNP